MLGAVRGEERSHAVVGIDLAAGRGTTEVAALCLNAGDPLPVFDPAAHRAVQTDEEIVELVAAARPVVIALDAPLSLPSVVAAALRGEVKPPQGFTDNSPYTRAAERDPLWGRLRVRPLPVSFLGGLTFRAIALLPKLRARQPAATIIEVFPTASLRVLGIRPAAPAGGARHRPAKASAAARMVVQQGLRALVAGIPAPDAHLLEADLLDALAAALTALAYVRGASVAVGDPVEGQIVLPRSADFPWL